MDLISTALARVAALTLAGLALSHCAGVRFQHAQPTPEHLAQEVLRALQRGDRRHLTSLALTQPEFQAHVWPALPAARPERNLPGEYVWTDLRQKSEQSLVRTLRAHAGQRYVLEHVRFDGSPTNYGTFVVHRKAVFLVRDAGGHRQELRLVGSMVQSDEGWKVFSFIVD